VSECDNESSIIRRLWPIGGFCAMVKMLCENIMAFLSENYTEHVIYYIKYCFQCFKGLVGVAIDFVSSSFLLKCRS